MILYRVVRAVVLSIFKVVFRVSVKGREHVPSSGVYIVAPSHRSILDIPFTAFVTKRRIRFMAKRELFSSRIGRVIFNAMGAISVDRGQHGSSGAARVPSRARKWRAPVDLS